VSEILGGASIQEGSLVFSLASPRVAACVGSPPAAAWSAVQEGRGVGNTGGGGARIQEGSLVFTWKTRQAVLEGGSDSCIYM